MMSMPFRVTLLSSCALTVSFSLYLFAQEYQVAYLLRGTTTDQIERLASGAPLPAPRSARSTRDLLTACGRILTTAPALRQDAATANAVRAGCRSVSDAILERAPAYGRARAVSVISYLPRISAAEYRAARIAAPYEPWPLLMRLESYARSGERPPELAGPAESGIAAALSYRWGRDEVARLYIAHPDLRAGIRSVADRQEGAVRTDFLRALRDATAKAG